MADENNSEFTAAEEAYFASGGDETKLETEAVIQAPELTTDEQSTEQAPVEPEQQENDSKGRVVPHGAFHAEREERKKAETRSAELERKLAVLSDRWDTMLAAGKPQDAAQQEETPPDPNVDIIGYMQFQAKKTQALDEKIASDTKQREEHAQAEQHERVIWDTWQSSVDQAKASKPDFDQAAGFLSQLRDSQLQAFSAVDPNFSNPQARVAQINAELRAIIISAKQQGQDPADAVYQIAKGYGYSGVVPEQQAGKIDKIIEAQAGSKTIAGMNGSSMSDPLSAQAILDMPASEFDAWMENPANAKRFDKILQGS